MDPNCPCPGAGLRELHGHVEPEALVARGLERFQRALVELLEVRGARALARGGHLAPAMVSLRLLVLRTSDLESSASEASLVLFRGPLIPFSADGIEDRVDGLRRIVPGHLPHVGKQLLVPLRHVVVPPQGSAFASVAA